MFGTHPSYLWPQNQHYPIWCIYLTLSETHCPTGHLHGIKESRVFQSAPVVGELVFDVPSTVTLKRAI